MQTIPPGDLPWWAVVPHTRAMTSPPTPRQQVGRGAAPLRDASPPPGFRARTSRLGLGALAALAVLLLLPTAAEAHALVVRSDPEAGASLIRGARAGTVSLPEGP